MRRSLYVLLLCAACGGSNGTPAGGPVAISGTQALFEVPAGTEMPDFFALPFPNDLRIKSDGTIDLAGFPQGRRPDVLRTFLTPIERLTKGWSTNAAMYFRFSAPIDLASLPGDPAASTQPTATVFLMDIDPASPRRGTRVPIKLKYFPTATVFVPERVLAVMPVTGIVLRPKTRYAAVVMRSLRDGAGASLGSPLAFETLKAATASTNADLERARQLYAPAFTELERAGVQRAGVASMAVFTTQDPTSELFRVRAAIRANVPEPDPRNLQCATEALYIKCTGEYDSPNYRAGNPPYQISGGNLVFDSGGNPVLQGTETLLFVLTIPRSTPQPTAGFPIALVAHGTTGSRESFLGSNDTGDVLARRGIAAIGIDQPLHGARDTFCPASNRDNCESFNTFNPANIAAARDNFRSGAADNFHLLRLVKRLSISANLTGLPSPVHFDPQKIFFFGHSQGGISGPLFLGVEPEVKGAVLSGAGGSLGNALLLKTAPVDIKGTIEDLLDIRGLNELDLFHPVMTLVQTFVEPADPMNYAGGAIADPPSGAAPKHILMTEGLGDSYTPNASAEALAVAYGLSPAMPVLRAVEGLSVLGRQPLAPPITANLTVGTASVTAVLAQYAQSTQDGHFVVYWNATARTQYGEFLRTLAENDSATFPAP